MKKLSKELYSLDKNYEASFSLPTTTTTSNNRIVNVKLPASVAYDLKKF